MVSAIFTDYVDRKQKTQKLLLFAVENLDKRKNFGRHKPSTKHGRQVQESTEQRTQTSSKESTVFVVLGTSMLWFGWFGFNAGSALAASPQCVLALINTNISAISGLITWYFLEILNGKKASVIGMCIGAVCGLVGITPACGFVPIYSSGIIGVFASLATFIFYSSMEKCSYKPDDRLGVFGCHGVSGIMGSILVGFFADKEIGATMDGIFQGGGGHLLGVQIAGICCSFAWSGALTFIIIWLMRLFRLFKVLDEENPDEEQDFDEQAVFIPDLNQIISMHKLPSKVFETGTNLILEEKKDESEKKLNHKKELKE